MQLISNNGSISGLQAVARDITQRKQVEGAMQSANEKLSNLERMKSKFLSTVSHELRTPIAIMREGVSLCLDGLAGPLTDQQRDLLTDTSSNIDRLNALIADLLDVNKVETGTERIERNTIHLHDMIQSVFDTFSNEIEAKQLNMHIEPQNGPLSLYADAEKIRQILTNLVSNALQFTGKGGSVTARVEEQESEIQISILDTGVGIARENMDKLFEKFEQFDRVDGPDCKGTGVGLAIAKGLVEHQGGRIWAESEPGKGSEFFFTVPKSPFPKILIVDDMESIIHIIKRFLSVDNYRFVEAMNGEDAIKAARDEAPDLIMLDMKLPKMSGYEVIGRLSQDIRTRDIPVLAMTGYAVDQQQLGQVDEEANIPIIGKPFEQEKLRAKVDSLLRQNA
jgi:signal transduction histidine kinase